jgi:hypothetical protein
MPWLRESLIDTDVRTRGIDMRRDDIYLYQAIDARVVLH